MGKKIWVILWGDGYDSGECFIEAYDSEEAADERCSELNEKDERYYVREQELNKQINRA